MIQWIEYYISEQIQVPQLQQNIEYYPQMINFKLLVLIFI